MPKGDNPNSRAALEKHRAATQFNGERANPQRQDIPGANKPWSVRNSVRYLGAQRIDPDDPKAIRKLLGKNPTASMLAAANCVTRAIKGDHRAFESMIDQIDGKLIQTNVNADFAAIQAMSDEELLEFINTPLPDYSAVIDERNEGESENRVHDSNGSEDDASGFAEPSDEAERPEGV